MIDISIYIYNLPKSKKNIDSEDKLIEYFEDSYNFYKTFKGFDIFLKSLNDKDQDYYVIEKDIFYLDHKNYCNLFLTFNSEKDILFYVQDTCEARGEPIVETFNSALDYLKKDGTKVYVVEKFVISKKIWEEINNKYSKKSKIQKLNWNKKTSIKLK